MNRLEKNKVGSCLWACRFEALGVILIIIATFLTIYSLDSFGIVMLFLVGGALCLHKHYGHCTQNLHCERDVYEPVCTEKEVSSAKHTTKHIKTGKKGSAS